jgi:uncharacterized protein YceK
MRAVLVVLMSVFLNGCGSCAQKAAELGAEKMTGVKVDDKGLTVNGPNGSTLEVGVQQLPADLPVKAPSDATVVMKTDEGAEGTQVIFTTSRPGPELAAEWEKALKAKGFQVERADNSVQTTEMVDVTFKGDVEGGISLQRETSEQPPVTMVTLRWKKGSAAKK